MSRRWSWARFLRRLRHLYVARRAAEFTRAYDLLLIMVYVIPARSLARRTVILCQFPYELAPRRAGRSLVSWATYSALLRIYRFLLAGLIGKAIEPTADVICQSEFVRRHVQMYWHRDAAVVHPPIDIPQAEPDWDAKRNVILSVGRFFVGGHSKRQDLMVKAFKQLCDDGLTGWELQLAGSAESADEAAMSWIAEIRSDIGDYPITIHTNVARDTLQDLYRQASIYWHWSGFGTDPLASPIDLEHFGMTTAEAMGSGAVPVVIKAGGQPEIVSDGEDGFLWSTEADLMSRTMTLTADPQMRSRMGAAARRSSLRFSRDAFRANMLGALGPIVRELEGDSAPAPPRPADTGSRT